MAVNDDFKVGNVIHHDNDNDNDNDTINQLNLNKTEILQEKVNECVSYLVPYLTFL